MTPLIGSLLRPRLHAMRANPDLLALWFAYALMLFSMAAMGPVLGEVKDEFNLTPATTALLVAVQGMGRGGFMLVLAPLADRMSPRLLLPLGFAAHRPGIHCHGRGAERVGLWRGHRGQCRR